MKGRRDEQKIPEENSFEIFSKKSRPSKSIDRGRSALLKIESSFPYSDAKFIERMSVQRFIFQLINFNLSLSTADLREKNDLFAVGLSCWLLENKIARLKCICYIEVQSTSTAILLFDKEA